MLKNKQNKLKCLWRKQTDKLSRNYLGIWDKFAIFVPENPYYRNREPTEFRTHIACNYK